jgi:hypothetical protein
MWHFPSIWLLLGIAGLAAIVVFSVWWFNPKDPYDRWIPVGVLVVAAVAVLVIGLFSGGDHPKQTTTAQSTATPSASGTPGAPQQGKPEPAAVVSAEAYRKLQRQYAAQQHELKHMVKAQEKEINKLRKHLKRTRSQLRKSRSLVRAKRLSKRRAVIVTTRSPATTTPQAAATASPQTPPPSSTPFRNPGGNQGGGGSRGPSPQAPPIRTPPSPDPAPHRSAPTAQAAPHKKQGVFWAPRH